MREMPVAAREKERKKKGEIVKLCAPDRQRRPMTRETGATEEETAPSVGYRIEGGGRWRGRRIERSYENKAKPEGGVRYAHATIDTQDRRSNFRSCHSDASWHVSPRLLHAFTHTL